jgi:RNA-directed DNA polymerase
VIHATSALLLGVARSGLENVRRELKLAVTVSFFYLMDQDERQRIYDAIKEKGSKRKYIYAEMKRLGFWDESNEYFEALETYFDEESNLSKTLNKLLLEKRNTDADPALLLKRIHDRRKRESREKQKAKKEERKRIRVEKAVKWKQSKARDIVYLGEGFSHELGKRYAEPELLKKHKLAEVNSAEDVAKAMGITIGELRFLAFARKNSPITHYEQFSIPKKTGGVRLISAPKPRLKKAQHWILENILNHIEMHDAAEGCVIGKSIKTNAEKHLKKAVVINQDMKDFFPTITYERIKGMFKSLGYSPQAATIFGLICSEASVQEVELNGERLYARRGDRFLPQGSPCSPAITNIICRKLDKRLQGLGDKYGFAYSRYVDDITFSGAADKLNKITAILKYSGKIIREENFNLHPDKLRIMKRGGRQEVTGVVVNEKPNVERKKVKRFKALVFQIEKDGLEGKTWDGNAEDLLPRIFGYASFIHQINPEKGADLKKRVDALISKYDYHPPLPKAKKPSQPKEPNTTPVHGQSTAPEKDEGLISRFKKWLGGT